jgi:hypothetical protein
MSTSNTLSRIARYQLAVAIVLAGVITNGADVWITLEAKALESNPIVLELGWGPWVAIKIAALVGLVGAWWLAREHRYARAVATGPLLVGLFGVLGNASASGWVATDTGKIGVGAGVVAFLLLGIGSIGVRKLRTGLYTVSSRSLAAASNIPKPQAKGTIAVVLTVFLVLSTQAPAIASNDHKITDKAGSVSPMIATSDGTLQGSFENYPDGWNETGAAGFGERSTTHASDGSYSLHTSLTGGEEEVTSNEITSNATGVSGEVANFNMSYDMWRSTSNGNHKFSIRITDGTENLGMKIYPFHYEFKIFGSVVNGTTTTDVVVPSDETKVNLQIVAEDRGGSPKMVVYADGSEVFSRDITGTWNSSETYVKINQTDYQNDQTEDYWIDDLTVAGGGPTESNVNGTVENQRGQGIANATVQLTISKKPTIPQADAQLDTLSNPIPTEYTQQLDSGFQLMGDSGKLANTDGQYAAIYETSDLGITWKQSADLRDPLVTNVPPGEEVALIIGDTEGDCGIAGFETNENNRQVPGCIQQTGNVSIEKLSPTGEVTATDSVSVEEAGNQRDFGGPTDLHYAPYTFTTGFYRISVERDDGSSISYIVKAGTPTPDFNQYARDANDQLTSQAQQTLDALSQDSLEIKTVATDESGNWNATVLSNAKVITVSARKAPGVDVAPEDLTYDNMTTAYNAEDPPNASVYLPSTTQRVQPGATNVRLTLHEVAFPSFAKLDSLQDRIEELRNKLDNLSFDDLPQALQQRLETESTEDLQRTWSAMRGTLENFEPAREAYLDISGRDSLPTADELSKTELQSAIRNANLAITQSASTAQATQTAAETTENTISRTWELVGIDADAANVSIIADYSNGTSRVISDEYITVDSSIVGTDVVRVEKLPMGDDDPAQVNLRLRVAGNNELATASSMVTNPQFSGEAPTIDAVELTSLQPGPSDRVEVQIHPGSDSTFRTITAMTVYGPGGDELDTTNITDGTTASFTTKGEGVHSIRFTVESTDSGTFTDVVRVEAAASAETMRPSIYAHSGALGTYAVVGDGFQSGDVDLANDGSVEVVGVLANGGDIPTTVDVFTEGLSTSAESTTTVRIVRGETRESVRKNIPVVVHGPRLNSPDDSRDYEAIAYANSKPVTWDGSTRYGVIEQDNDGSSIQAYTADDGVLTLKVNNDPGRLERFTFSLQQRFPWAFGIGFLGSGTSLLAGFVLVRRRRGAAN